MQQQRQLQQPKQQQQQALEQAHKTQAQLLAAGHALMTKRFAGRLASDRCQCAAAANDTQIGGAAGDASQAAHTARIAATATSSRCSRCHRQQRQLYGHPNPGAHCHQCQANFGGDHTQWHHHQHDHIASAEDEARRQVLPGGRRCLQL